MIFFRSGQLVINLASGLGDPLDTVTDLLPRFAHHVAQVFGGESVGVDIDIHSIVTMWTAGLRDDAQIKRINAKLAQSLAYLVHLRLIQHPSPREDRGALSMGERQLLAREYAGVSVVVGHEHHVGSASSYI